MLKDFYSAMTKYKIGVGTELKNQETSVVERVTRMKFNYGMIQVYLGETSYQLEDIKDNVLVLKYRVEPVYMEVTQGYNQPQNKEYGKFLGILKKVPDLEIGQIYDLNGFDKVITKEGNDWVELCPYTKEYGIGTTDVFNRVCVTKMFFLDYASYKGKMDEKKLSAQYITMQMLGRI